MSWSSGVSKVVRDRKKQKTKIEKGFVKPYMTEIAAVDLQYSSVQKIQIQIEMVNSTTASVAVGLS